MARPKPDPAEAKLKKQLRNQRYRANLDAKARNREYDRIYRRTRRQEAGQGQHHNDLIQLADIVAQQQYLETRNESSAGLSTPEPRVQDITERNVEGLEDFGQEGGFNDENEPESNDAGISL